MQAPSKALSRHYRKFYNKPHQNLGVNKKSFVCRRCGSCCKPLVIVTKVDIARLKKTGRKEADFVMSDGRKKVLKNTGRCIFLSFSGRKAFCKVYEYRPKICRTYPFFKKEIFDCKPKSLFSKIGIFLPFRGKPL